MDRLFEVDDYNRSLAPRNLKPYNPLSLQQRKMGLERVRQARAVLRDKGGKEEL